MPEFEFKAPSSSSGPTEPPSQRLTNEDFRRLMMTPRGNSGAPATPALGSGTLGAGAAAATPRIGAPSVKTTAKKSESAEKRKKKKSHYAKLKREEDEKMAELAAKYRDRARERRDGAPEMPQVGPDGTVGGSAAAEATGGYRAVAPDLKGTIDAAERRRRMIQESKFLGGDMEHTHLVKGLDFALLQKVRSEIANRESGEIEEEEAKEETTEEKKKEEPDMKEDKIIKEKVDPFQELHGQCKSIMAKNIVRNLFKPDLPAVNELFFPGRMAYIIDLEDEFAESDIPTTTIRSKADIEGGISQQTTLSTNDIVINKLTQILSYLRAGSRNKKKKKEKLLQEEKREEEILREEQKAAQLANLPIYDDEDLRNNKRSSKRDLDNKDRRHREREANYDRRDHYKDDYRSRRGDERNHRDRERDRDRHQESSKKRSYFDKHEEEDDLKHDGGLSNQDREYIRKLSERERHKEKRLTEASKGGIGLASSDPQGYNECYPDLTEMYDAIDDSDDEADFSKMDLGSKKGPIGRWDFDTAEEYAEYMSSKEAMPKAAFQYGVKMTAGRKTRGKIGPKTEKAEKAKLDREWNKISAIIEKRKTSDGGRSSSKKAKFD